MISSSTERDFGHRESFYYIAANHGEAGVPGRPQRTPDGLAIRESSGTVLWRCEFTRFERRRARTPVAPSANSHQPTGISHQPTAISHQPSACYFTSSMLTIFEAVWNFL